MLHQCNSNNKYKIQILNKFNNNKKKKKSMIINNIWMVISWIY